MPLHEQADAFPVAEEAKNGIFLSVVLPAYNEANSVGPYLRSIAGVARTHGYRFEIIVVDDGSTDGTLALVRSMTAEIPETRILVNEVNRKKGYSVRRGVLESQGRYVLCADSDGAYPADQIPRFVSELEKGADVAIANRRSSHSRFTTGPSMFRYIHIRHILSGLFNALVRAVLLGDVEDSQSGFKAFRGSVARKAFAMLRILDFGFDLEILCICARNQCRIRQMPVHFVYSHEPSKVRLARDAMRMLAQLLRITINAGRGRYDWREPP